MKQIFLTILIYFAVSVFSQSKDIQIITYHSHAPFIVGNEEGLTYDLAKYLSKKTEYNFTVKQMSRPKLDSLLSKDIHVIVPWVNPVWFKDIKEEKFLWTDFSLIDDSISYISSMDSPFNYNGVDSLKNNVFGGLKGHYYKDIDKLVDDKQIIRLDSDNHIDNYRKLLVNKIDYTISPTSAVKYLLKKYEMSTSLFISIGTNSSYKRKIIIVGKDDRFKSTLDQVIYEMKSDDVWITILEKYR